MLYFPHLYYRQHFTILVSHSKDGEFVSRVLQRFGAHLNRCGRRSRSTIAAWGAQPLIYRCDLYRLSFVLRQGAAERHAN